MWSTLGQLRRSLPIVKVGRRRLPNIWVGIRSESLNIRDRNFSLKLVELIDCVLSDAWIRIVERLDQGRNRSLSINLCEVSKDGPSHQRSGIVMATRDFWPRVGDSAEDRESIDDRGNHQFVFVIQM